MSVDRMSSLARTDAPAHWESTGTEAPAGSWPAYGRFLVLHLQTRQCLQSSLRLDVEEPTRTSSPTAWTYASPYLYHLKRTEDPAAF